MESVLGKIEGNEINRRGRRKWNKSSRNEFTKGNREIEGVRRFLLSPFCHFIDRFHFPMETLTGRGSFFHDMDGFIAYVQCSLVEGLREGGMGKDHRFDILHSDLMLHGHGPQVD